MNSLLSIDIGAKRVHIAEGSFNRGILTVSRSASADIQPGVIREEYIENMGQLTEQIASIIKINDFRAKDVVLTINACNALVRDVDLPDAKPKEVDNMIRNELYQTYHVLTTDVIQYKAIEKVTGEQGGSLNRYRVCALDADLVESYHELVSNLRLKPVALDININAIDKLLAASSSINDAPIGEEPVLLLDFGGVFTTVYIYAKGKPLFFRHLKMGSSEIETGLATVLSSMDQIRYMKESGHDFFNLDSEDGQRQFEMLKPFLYRFNDEIRKIIGFYTSRNTSSNVINAYLFGAGSLLNGFPEYLSANINLPFERIRSVGGVSAEEPEQALMERLNAIGALIRL